MEKVTQYLIQSTVHTKHTVKAWAEKVTLPTYEVGAEEKNPIFLEKRVYQASSGSVYPYPVIEKISDTKVDKEYMAFFLENYYIKVMILPELGGRVQMAYDKIRQRHFVYYNQVIKPALVGLTGPWISGGIEFNWPQHHRPSTFLPTDAKIEQHQDGSVTVWCNEIERMNRTKGAQGFTLYPDKAYLEINVRLYNRTPFPQTFLWWANPAVTVGDKYYSVFPPDINAVFDHGKRAVTEFPISKGVYYKYDYSPGTDISRYKNIPVPTSYMAVLSKYDFIGGYDEGERAGLLHVANHHVSSGKKQWTWGNGEFGQAWDRNLTDEDGPYIELMTGVYCDNQPDFSWLQPFEEKEWKQYFMPYAEVGYVKQANTDLVLNFTKKDGKAEIIIYATSDFEDAKCRIYNQSKQLVYEQQMNLSPETPFIDKMEVATGKKDLYTVEITSEKGQLLLKYEEEILKDQDLIPEPAKPAKMPEEITSIEQLFLTGLHLEQYHHATYEPMDYYMEALRREPGDVRCNNAVGLLLLRKGKFEQAEAHFKRAIETLQERNPNPYDGEAFYNLGLALKWQHKFDEAYDAFFKSTWNAAWQASAYYELALIDMRRKDYKMALKNINHALVMNWHNHKARQLKASILRVSDHKQECKELIEESLRLDAFNMGILWEKFMLTKDSDKVEEQLENMRGTVHDYLEYAFDFADAGLYEEAKQIIEVYLQHTQKAYPMAYYYMGYFEQMMGNTRKGDAYYQKAELCDADHCFPNRVEEVIVLKQVIEHMNEQCPKALYYLGNFLYSKKLHQEAINLWEKSAKLDDKFPTVLRNLALGLYNKLHQEKEALKMMERAFELDESDARIFMELDQLYKKLNYEYEFRLRLHEKHMALVEMRDDVYIEYIQLLNQTGQFEKAKSLIAQRHFHPWEGGEGLITKQFIVCNVALAHKAMQNGDYDKAWSLLAETDHYPHNLGEGKLTTIEESNIHYYKGLVLEGMGKSEEANVEFRKGAAGKVELSQAMYYYDSDPAQVYYKALSMIKAGEEQRAKELFEALIKYGKEHLNDECKIEYFAVSLPDLAIWEMDLTYKNHLHCLYLMGLGELGLEEYVNASKLLSQAHEGDIYNQDVQHYLAKCECEMAKEKCA